MIDYEKNLIFFMQAKIKKWRAISQRIPHTKVLVYRVYMLCSIRNVYRVFSICILYRIYSIYIEYAAYI